MTKKSSTTFHTSMPLSRSTHTKASDQDTKPRGDVPLPNSSRKLHTTPTPGTCMP